ncbi:MAG: hypothetical protein P4L31_08240 [Candidatus Babeliales bacterium]|nr:hypothetical protein [Candidatus Babeliales bacterium]
MRNSLIAIMILTLCPAPLMRAETGCIDNSWHLARAYDPKTYHLVSNCTCPCSRYSQSEDRGRCSKCKHFRDPRPLIIIQPSKENGSIALKKEPVRKTVTKREKQVSWRTH